MIDSNLKDIEKKEYITRIGEAAKELAILNEKEEKYISRIDEITRLGADFLNEKITKIKEEEITTFHVYLVDYVSFFSQKLNTAEKCVSITDNKKSNRLFTDDLLEFSKASILQKVFIIMASILINKEIKEYYLPLDIIKLNDEILPYLKYEFSLEKENNIKDIDYLNDNLILSLSYKYAFIFNILKGLEYAKEENKVNNLKIKKDYIIINHFLSKINKIIDVSNPSIYNILNVEKDIFYKNQMSFNSYLSGTYNKTSFVRDIINSDFVIFDLVKNF